MLGHTFLSGERGLSQSIFGIALISQAHSEQRGMLSHDKCSLSDVAAFEHAASMLRSLI